VNSLYAAPPGLVLTVQATRVPPLLTRARLMNLAIRAKRWRAARWIGSIAPAQSIRAGSIDPPRPARPSLSDFVLAHRLSGTSSAPTCSASTSTRRVCCPSPEAWAARTPQRSRHGHRPAASPSRGALPRRPPRSRTPPPASTDAGRTCPSPRAAGACGSSYLSTARPTPPVHAAAPTAYACGEGGHGGGAKRGGCMRAGGGDDVRVASGDEAVTWGSEAGWGPSAARHSASLPLGA